MASSPRHEDSCEAVDQDEHVLPATTGTHTGIPLTEENCAALTPVSSAQSAEDAYILIPRRFHVCTDKTARRSTKMSDRQSTDTHLFSFFQEPNVSLTSGLSFKGSTFDSNMSVSVSRVPAFGAEIEEDEVNPPALSLRLTISSTPANNASCDALPSSSHCLDRPSDLVSVAEKVFKDDLSVLKYGDVMEHSGVGFDMQLEPDGIAHLTPRMRRNVPVNSGGQSRVIQLSFDAEIEGIYLWNEGASVYTFTSLEDGNPEEVQTHFYMPEEGQKIHRRLARWSLGLEEHQEASVSHAAQSPEVPVIRAAEDPQEELQPHSCCRLL